jgi:NAD(P)-dependent dehydrogenase (short-subunit alcohol dehydrogenase family)
LNIHNPSTNCLKARQTYHPCSTVSLLIDKSSAASIKKVVEKFGRLDVVVNNAGYGLGGALEALTSKEIDGNFQNKLRYRKLVPIELDPITQPHQSLIQFLTEKDDISCKK